MPPNPSRFLDLPTALQNHLSTVSDSAPKFFLLYYHFDCSEASICTDYLFKRFSVKRVCFERCSFSIVRGFLGRQKSWLDTFVGTHFGQESMDILHLHVKVYWMSTENFGYMYNSKVKRIKSDLSKVTKLQSVFSFLSNGQKRELLYRQFMFFLYAPRIRIYTIWTLIA